MSFFKQIFLRPPNHPHCSISLVINSLTSSAVIPGVVILMVLFRDVEPCCKYMSFFFTFSMDRRYNRSSALASPFRATPAICTPISSLEMSRNRTQRAGYSKTINKTVRKHQTVETSAMLQNIILFLGKPEKSLGRWVDPKNTQLTRWAN